MVVALLYNILFVIKVKQTNESPNTLCFFDIMKVKRWLRAMYNWNNRRRLKNRDFTLIASNCVGGTILHDLNLPFNSPFVNLWLEPKDFLKFCERMNHYLDLDFRFIKIDGINYPIGVLDDIKIYFQHYSSEEDAESAWIRRKQRIDMNNIFVMFTDRDGCTYEDLIRFDKLAIKNKVVFTHIKYSGIPSAYYIPGFESETCVGQLMYSKNKFSLEKYYDAFDYVSWFNGIISSPFK